MNNPPGPRETVAELPSPAVTIAASDQPASTQQETTNNDDSASFAESADGETFWHPGKVIQGRYQVVRLLGEGGMGKVYQVHHVGWSKDLAVKRPKASLFSAERVRDFIHEAESWVDLGEHPNVVSCYFVKTIEGSPCVFAEYISEGTLTDRITSNRLYSGGKEEALRSILDIAIQSAWGLTYAHRKGLVHQDVKPQNILVSHNGVAKITDLGLARWQRRDALGGASMTAASMSAAASVGVTTMGMSPAYCSPEQAKAVRVTQATDVWSWAITLLEMFTGELLWRSGLAAPEILEGLRSGIIERPDIPRLPDTMHSILQRCLSVLPENRPKMQEAAEELVEAYTQLFARKFPRALYDSPHLVADSWNNRALSFIELDRRQDAKGLFEQALARDPRHITAAYNYCLLEIQSDGRDVDDVAQVLVSLPIEENKKTQLAQRIADYYEFVGYWDAEAVRSNDKNDTKGICCRLSAHQDHVTTLAAHPSGQYLASGSCDGWVYVWAPTTKKPLYSYFLPHASIIGVDFLGPRVLITTQDGSLFVADPETSEVIETAKTPHQASILARYYCEKADYLALIIDGGKLLLYENMTRAQNSISRQIANVEGVSAIEGDGYSLYLGDVAGRFVAIDGQSGHELFRAQTIDSLIRSICLSIDGSTILLGYENGSISAVDKNGKVLCSRGACHRGAVNAMVCLEHGEFATGGRDGELRIWRLDSNEQGSMTLTNVRNYSKLGHCVNTLQSLQTRAGQLTYCGTGGGLIRAWRFSLGNVTPYEPAEPFAAEDLTALQFEFSEAVAQARKLNEQKDALRSKLALRRAREVKGYEQAPEALALEKKVTRQLSRGRLISANSAVMPTPLGRALGACMSPNGKMIATAGKTGIFFWDTANSRALGKIPMTVTGDYSMSFSWDCRVLVTCSSDGVRAYEVQSGQLVFWELEKGDISLSFDGRFLLTGESLLELPNAVPIVDWSKVAVRYTEWIDEVATVLSQKQRIIARIRAMGKLFLILVLIGFVVLFLLLFSLAGKSGFLAFTKLIWTAPHRGQLERVMI